MGKILDRLPLVARTGPVSFGQRHVTVFRDELLIWVSVGLHGEESVERLSPPFPALLDSGNNYDFYLNEHHLVHWAGIRPDQVALLGTKYINRQEVPRRQADVWLYPNQPGTTDIWRGKAPFHLEVPDGIAIRPANPEALVEPRLPLLGFPALRTNELDFWFDSKAARCHVWTAGWRGRIVRLLSRL
jgi:hypothetical protein